MTKHGRLRRYMMRYHRRQKSSYELDADGLMEMWRLLGITIRHMHPESKKLRKHLPLVYRL